MFPKNREQYIRKRRVLAFVVVRLTTKLNRMIALVAERLRGNREQRIRERAYFLWRQSGCPVGRDLDFWLQASRFESHWFWPGCLRDWLGNQRVDTGHDGSRIDATPAPPAISSE